MATLNGKPLLLWEWIRKLFLIVVSSVIMLTTDWQPAPSSSATEEEDGPNGSMFSNHSSKSLLPLTFPLFLS